MVLYGARANEVLKPVSRLWSLFNNQSLGFLARINLRGDDEIIRAHPLDSIVTELNQNLGSARRLARRRRPPVRLAHPSNESHQLLRIPIRGGKLPTETLKVPPTRANLPIPNLFPVNLLFREIQLGRVLLRRAVHVFIDQHDHLRHTLRDLQDVIRVRVSERFRRETALNLPRRRVAGADVPAETPEVFLAFAHAAHSGRRGRPGSSRRRHRAGHRRGAGGGGG